jgi:hypothetical protein
MSKKKALLLVVGLLVVILVPVMVVNGLRSQAESREFASWASPFESHLEEYLQASEAVDEWSPGPPTPEEGPIRGKLVIVDLLHDELDELNSSEGLADLRAESPEEVGTLVGANYWSTWDHTMHAGAINKSYYNYNIDVTVIDFAQKTVICQRTFSSSGTEKTHDGQFTAPGLPDEVVAYLQSLPRE